MNDKKKQTIVDKLVEHQLLKVLKQYEFNVYQDIMYDRDSIVVEIKERETYNANKIDVFDEPEVNNENFYPITSKLFYTDEKGVKLIKLVVYKLYSKFFNLTALKHIEMMIEETLTNCLKDY